MYQETIITLDSNDLIKYHILKGNALSYPMNENKDIAFHYAFENTFIVDIPLQAQTLNVTEGSFFISKTSNNYMLKSSKASSSTIVTLQVPYNHINEKYIANHDNNSALKSFLLNPNIDYGIFQSSHNTLIHKEMKESFKFLIKDGYISQKLLHCLLDEVIIQLEHNYECSNKASFTLIKDILSYIRSHPTTVNLKVLAQKYNYSVSYISELIHKETGLTFSQTLKAIRMAKSLELLKDTNKTVGEISEAIGYTTTSGFITAFQDMYKLTPTEYRRNNSHLC